MVDLSERENGLWGRERGDRANLELNFPYFTFFLSFSVSLIVLKNFAHLKATAT